MQVRGRTRNPSASNPSAVASAPGIFPFFALGGVPKNPMGRLEMLALRTASL